MRYILTILILFISASEADARFAKVNDKTIDKEKATMTAYEDSLKLLRQHVDSLQKALESLSADSQKILNTKYYRLFSPLTYDPKITAGMLNPNAVRSQSVEDQEMDSVLLRYFLSRPDLVQTSVSRLHKSAESAGELPSSPVKRKVEIQKTVQPEEEKQIDDYTPVDIKIFKPNFWKFSGDYSLQFLQNYISENWYKGGESNLSAVGNVVLKLNYNNKQKVKFENTLEMKLGLQTSESDTLHSLKTSTDMLRYTGKLSLQAIKKWDYAFQMIATTQFMRTFKSNNSTVYSDFFSPLELNFSIGMDYTISTKNKKLNGSVHLAPIALNFKYVDRLALSTRFGLDEGEHTLTDMGSQMTLNLTWKPNNDIKWTSRLYAYTTYKRAVVEFENTISFAISKFVSTNLFLYPRFDDGVSRRDDNDYWQMKEYFALGFSYSM